MTKLAIKFIKILLRRNLSIDEANELTALVLDKTGALPFKEIITHEGNELYINGVPVDFEKARLIRESALAALENPALRIVREQAAFAAVSYGVHKAETPAQMFFARAALWWAQQEQRFLEILAQQH